MPVASLEEPESGQADYACCTFRGYMSALDAATGRQIWKTYTIPDVPKVVGKNSRGKDMLEPAGAGIWATPTLDVKRRALYVTTGNAFSGTPKTANAVMAMNIDTGKVLWSMQALAFDTWHNGCVQNIPGGAFPARGGGGGRGGRAGGPAIPYPPENCPAVLGPDWDFAAPAALATTTDGRDILIAPQKQGLVWAVNPDNGQVLWKQDVAREIAGGRGETLFGGAVDNEKAYFGLISSGHLALDLKTGEEVWYTPLVPPQGRENQRGVVGAVTLIPGVLLSGARDGMIRAASSRTGQLLWEFDSAKEFTTVNGVPGARRLRRLGRAGRRQRHGVHRLGVSGLPGGTAGKCPPCVRADRAARRACRRVEAEAGRHAEPALKRRVLRRPGLQTGAIGSGSGAAGPGQSQSTEDYANQAHDESHDGAELPGAGADRTSGASQMQPTEGRSDQPCRQRHDGPESPEPGADSTAGSGQSHSTGDHADQPHPHRDEGPEPPRSGANTVGGARDLRGRRCGKREHHEQGLHRFWENRGYIGHTKLHEHPPCHLHLISFVRDKTNQTARM